MTTSQAIAIDAIIVKHKGSCIAQAIFIALHLGFPDDSLDHVLKQFKIYRSQKLNPDTDELLMIKYCLNHIAALDHEGVWGQVQIEKNNTEGDRSAMARRSETDYHRSPSSFPPIDDDSK